MGVHPDLRSGVPLPEQRQRCLLPGRAASIVAAVLREEHHCAGRGERPSEAPPPVAATLGHRNQAWLSRYTPIAIIRPHTTTTVVMGSPRMSQARTAARTGVRYE